MKLAATDAAKAVQMLDLLGEFFADGSRWIRGEFHDDDGNRCLVGAMRHIRAVRNFMATRRAITCKRRWRKKRKGWSRSMTAAAISRNCAV